jgi:inhibitor of KinA
VSALPRIVPAGDSALIVEFEDRLDAAVNARAIALARAIAARHLPGVRDVVPTYRTVAIYFDPLRVDYDRLLALASPASDQSGGATGQAAAPAPATVRLPVCYGGDLGPDLPDVASFAGATEDEVVQLHGSMTYRVFMVGFVAGFAYLGTVHPRIAMPRHSTPRLRVPAGSVGIAGAQTGVYPAETPGGWRLIGRSPLKPFDPQRADPFLMKAGDAVAFYPITRAEYDAWPSS